MKKQCSKCKELKNLDEFCKNRSRKDGLEYWCRECKHIRMKGYRERPEIKERDEEYQKEYRQTERGKEVNRNGVRRYTERFPERVKESDRKSKQKYPEKMRIKNGRRRARKLNAEGSHTVEEWVDKKKEYNYRCFYCGIHENALCRKYKDKKWWKLTEDHLKALSKKGSNYIGNIVPACISCNASKNNKDL